MIDAFAFIPLEKASGVSSGALDFFELIEKARDAAAGESPDSARGQIKEQLKNGGARLGSEVGSRLGGLLG